MSAFPQSQFGQPDQFSLAQQIQTEVHRTMQAFYEQQALQQQAAVQPVSDPVWDRLLAQETVLLDSAIKSNKRLAALFGKHSFEDAIAGKAGEQAKVLAQRIDAALDAASDDGTVKMPLSDTKAIVAAMKEGVQDYARLAVGQSNEQSVAQFASEVVGGSQSPDRSESSGDAEAIDYDREGPQNTGSFDDISADEVASHFKSSVEQHGGEFEVPEKSIAETAPAAGQEPTGFYDA